MALLQKLKSLLGLESGRRTARGSRGGREEAGVTVEREPSTGAEDAVKGTETDASAGQGTTEAAAGAAATEGASAGGTDGESGPSEAEGAPGGEATDAGRPVTEVQGVGPAYRERLSAAGIETVADLAAADAEAVAAETDIAEGRVKNFVERARER